MGCLRSHAVGAYRFRMYTMLPFAFNNSYCHVVDDLQCSVKQTFLLGLTDMSGDGQMTLLLSAPKIVRINHYT